MQPDDVGSLTAGMIVSTCRAETMTVTVPENSSGGQTILLETPDGQELELLVPDGLLEKSSSSSSIRNEGKPMK